ncbi:MAG: Penicillin-binding protein 4* [Bacteroidetes bacterium ADurb.BinA174]|nr:MAG: Penicillin-binding protein 4* [Bacteroidetes bacterium ADurb.BinA174]
MQKQFIGFIFALLLISFQTEAQHLQLVSPEKVGMDSKRLKNADKAIKKAIADKEIPGAVLAVVKNGKMAYLKAYGNKQITPTTVSMDVNTVFDLASVTKPVATAISAMVLIERGELRFLDKVNLFIPDFAAWTDSTGRKKDIRVIDLMTHTSGLPPYAPVNELEKKYGSPNPDGMIEYISTCRRDFEPQTNFQYSCLNYITLQRIIETISKQNLRDFAKQNIFDVLGMNHTDFQPKGETLRRTAPTQRTVPTGQVHDPLARVMNGGISGNAGLFSDANDLAILAVALLNNGEYNGKRILSPLGVNAMRTIPRSVSTLGRTPGWDIFTPYASNNGDLFSPNTYGHTGYTGTSMVIDPDNDIAVILLTNRAHPDDAGDAIRLRSLVANAVAASIIEIK